MDEWHIVVLVVLYTVAAIPVGFAHDLVRFGRPSNIVAPTLLPTLALWPLAVPVLAFAWFGAHMHGKRRTPQPVLGLEPERDPRTKPRVGDRLWTIRRSYQVLSVTRFHVTANVRVIEFGKSAVTKKLSMEDWQQRMRKASYSKEPQLNNREVRAYSWIDDDKFSMGAYFLVFWDANGTETVLYKSCGINVWSQMPIGSWNTEKLAGMGRRMLDPEHTRCLLGMLRSFCDENPGKLFTHPFKRVATSSLSWCTYPAIRLYEALKIA